MKLQIIHSLEIESDNINSLADLTNIIKAEKLESRFLKLGIKRLDEFETKMATGKKYIGENGFKKSGTSTFTFNSDFGEIEVQLNRIKKVREAGRENEGSHHTLSRITKIGRTQLSGDFKNNIRSMVPNTSYRRLAEMLTSIIGKGFYKDQIWKIVEELGIGDCHTYNVDPNDYDVVMIDGSGGQSSRHKWFLVVGLNTETAKMTPIHHSVHRSIVEIRQLLESKGLLNIKDHTIIADGEGGIQNQFKEYKMQMCSWHFERSITFSLQKNGMSMEDRKKINRKVITLLMKLKNSVHKNIGNKVKMKKERLEERIKKTKIGLLNVAQNLFSRGYETASNFIKRRLQNVIRYASEALNLVKIPWTNNIMERFIGEISFRVKNMWATWSDKGLNSIIYIIVNKYCERNKPVIEF